MGAADDRDEDDQAHHSGDATDYEPVLSWAWGEPPAEDRLECCHQIVKLRVISHVHCQTSNQRDDPETDIGSVMGWPTNTTTQATF